MTDPTAVVTGANGYLARALIAKLLALGVDIRAISRSSIPARPGVTWAHADVRDSDALAPIMCGANVVFHLAAHAHDIRSTDDTRLQQAVTLGGTIAALAAAERSGVRHFVFVSSLAVHGLVGATAASEDHSCNPRTPYGRAKLDAERAVSAFAARTGANAASIRPAMIYGLGCPGNLARMIRAVRRGTFPPIPDFGNRRSMVAVDDVAQALLLAWKANVQGGRPFIVTDGEGYSTRRIYVMIREALGLGAPAVSIPRACFNIAAHAGDVGGAILRRRLPFDSEALDRLAGSSLFNSDRARRELGFAPTSTLPDLLPEMVRHGS